ncbi:MULTISPECIES: IS1182 family transposase [unclassified Streptomyces]|uniref:IS1182 family transposase n=1 Tax=Streptomyces sp. NBC_00119 TaxID=2975659 RepID=A0AAU1U1J1_9ACTN|nr:MULTISPECIES: IS1182 family transposase [unclassified Streptomyces]MCX4641626.1 IS1182 family transposase [Streptomyces sp. NBC_01446]MCX4641824.1 IS1182 family transposase [Streptomyces sp. NBC_01446]MCX4644834.1 IS1182 family transposase [Streptomyces sp. NBC_01446]MCX4646645.1 IS1182 family transposase [Streptomyces sp. NBC_01446]MCX4648183.1 IS1182 family transposase [Streptomyces sp. NBC_01446]
MGEWAGETIGPDVWETCRDLIPAGSVFAFLAEHRSALFEAEMFADMYPSANGRPSMPPQILAASITLQALHGLSDFETVQELRCDLRWKAACGLGLHDMAFDPSLLAYFRRRLARSARPNRVFEAVREVVKATGVLKGKHRRALDSTVLDDAVATQDTVTQIIAAIRAVIREVPGAGEVAAVQCTAHDYNDPGKPRIAWNDEQARADLVDALVGDALRLLGHLPEQQLDEKAANAVGILALVAGQDVEPAEDSDGRDGRWRITQGTAPNRMVSTVDPEARHVHKTRTHQQDGFKAHLAMEPETGLYTAVALRPGAGPEHHEAMVGIDLLTDEDEPVDAFGDTAYSTGDARHSLETAGHRLFLKPAPLRPAVPGGFTLDDFIIDTGAATVTCPAGHTVPLSAPAGQHHQRKASFKDVCAGCPLRERCTKAKAGRILTIRPHHDLLAAARHQTATDPDWQADYRRWRPPVERAVAWLVHHNNRKLRYRGTIKNDAWLHTRAAALNLRRLINLGLTRTNGTWHLTPVNT